MKTKLEIYALAVCFASSMCLVISLGTGTYAALSIAAPELTLNSHNYGTLQSNDAYWEQKTRFKEKQDVGSRPEEAVLTEQRLAAYAIAINGERRDGLQSLLRSGIYAFFAAIFLFVHWRIARSARA